MHDDERPPASRAQPDQVEPGDRPPPGRTPRHLERAPGERYPSEASSASRRVRRSTAPGRATGTAAIVGTAVGGAVLFGLVGSIDLGPGLVVLALFIGWAVALSLIWAIPVRDAKRRWLRPALGAVLATGSVAGGLLLLWAWALAEGGVLGPVAYADARFGLLVPVLVVAAAAVAAVRAR